MRDVGPAIDRGPAEDPESVLLLAPPLAILAAWVAVLELSLNRVIPLSLHVLGDHRALLLLRLGPLPRNVACVAGIIALAVTFYGFLRMAGWSTLIRRVQIAALSGLLFPSLLLGLLLPKDRMIAPVVLIAVGVGHAIVALLGIVVIRYHRSPTRVASLATMITSALVLTLLVTSSLEAVQRFLTTPDSLAAKITWAVMAGSRLCGELVWCSVPWLALGPHLRSLARERLAGPMLKGGVVVALALAALIEATLHPNLSILGYSAFRLTFLDESLAGLYALFALLALALAIAATTSERPEVRQLGAAVLLWIACGFAPRSLSQVLYFVLAAALFSRVTQGTDPEGRRRARLSWGAPLEAPQIPADLRD